MTVYSQSLRLSLVPTPQSIQKTSVWGTKHLNTTDRGILIQGKLYRESWCLAFVFFPTLSSYRKNTCCCTDLILRGPKNLPYTLDTDASWYRSPRLFNPLLDVKIQDQFLLEGAKSADSKNVTWLRHTWVCIHSARLLSLHVLSSFSAWPASPLHQCGFTNVPLEFTYCTGNYYMTVKDITHLTWPLPSH